MPGYLSDNKFVAGRDRGRRARRHPLLNLAGSTFCVLPSLDDVPSDGVGLIPVGDINDRPDEFFRSLFCPAPPTAW